MKTITQHLFDQLERLSTATNETIDLEVKKAEKVVSISEQVLKVANLKLDILNSTRDMTSFTEIDDDKKKLN